MKAKHAAIAGLTLGLLIAVAANLTYAIPRGPVVVGLGLVAPLVLPVVLHLRTTFTVSGFWAVSIRELSTLAVAGPAVAISYVHTYELILGAGEPWLLAVLAPLSSDGLAGLATLALYQAHRRSGTKVTATPRPEPEQSPVPAQQRLTPPAASKTDDELAEVRRAKEREKKRRQREAAKKAREAGTANG